MSIPLPISSSRDSKSTLDGSEDDDPAEAMADSSPTQNELQAAVPEGKDTFNSVQQISTDDPPDQVKLTCDQGHQNQMTHSEADDLTNSEVSSV